MSLPAPLRDLLYTLYDLLPATPPFVSSLLPPLPLPLSFYLVPLLLCVIISLIVMKPVNAPPPQSAAASSMANPAAAAARGPSGSTTARAARDTSSSSSACSVYSRTSSISDGSRPQALQPMSLRELTPNRVHLEVGHWSDVGQRGYQEDRYCVSWLCQNAAKEDVSIVGVYDGHGGCEASQYLADRMCTYITSDERFPDGCIEDVLHDAFMDVDVDFINTGKPDGSTVNVCIFVGNRRVYCANAGDSRSVLVKKGGGVVALSKDHKPGDADETKRITDLGGTVVYWGRWRVQSVLAVSRSVGDAQLMPYITAEPNVVVHDVTEDDLWVVTASDGIWDVMDNNAVGKFMWQECGASDDGGDDEFLKWSGRKLCDEAGRLLSGDNVTAVVTRLN